MTFAVAPATSADAPFFNASGASKLKDDTEEGAPAQAKSAVPDPQAEDYDATGLQKAPAFTLRQIGDADAGRLILFAAVIAPQ